MTTIESKEKKYKDKSSKYDLGLCKNFLQVFGKNPLFWFFPINFENKLNGYSYEIKEEINFYKNNGQRFISQTSDKSMLFDSRPDLETLGNV